MASTNSRHTFNGNDSPSRPSIERDSRPEDREWSEFELQAVLSLLCKRVHLLPGNPLTFATQLNEALNSGRNGGGFEHDVHLDDVKALLMYINMEKKGPLEVLERMRPRRISTSSMSH